MRRIAFMSVAALCAARCFGIAASQAWVISYVAGLNGGTNGVISVDAGNGRTITATYELFTEPALMVTNSANAAVTNGMLFAWNGSGAYVNAPAAKTVTATATNLVFGAAQSAVVGGVDTFADAPGGAFAVVSRPITKSDAKRLKGGAQ